MPWDRRAPARLRSGSCFLFSALPICRRRKNQSQAGAWRSQAGGLAVRILGISAFQRRAAAALVVDGKAVAAACEENFTRLALDPAFPVRAIHWCLARAGIAGGELDAAVFYEKPLRRFERVLVRAVETFPREPRAFVRSAFVWLGDRLWLR